MGMNEKTPNAKVFQKYFKADLLEDLLHNMGAWMEEFPGDAVEGVIIVFNDNDYWEGFIYYD